MTDGPAHSRHDACAPISRTCRSNLDGESHLPLAKSPATISSAGDGNGAFVRNKAEQEKIFRKLRELQRYIDDGVPEQLLHQSGSISEMLSSVQDINQQNESTIKHLQQQLMDVAKERNDARRKSDELEADVGQLQRGIHQERVGFAGVSHKHRKEIQGWKRTVKNLRDKMRRMKGRLKQQEHALKLKEVQRVMSAAPEGDAPASPPAPTEANAPSEADGVAGGKDLRSANKAIATLLLEVDRWRDRYAEAETLNDELMDKIGQVSDENLQFVIKIEGLEDQMASSNTASLDTLSTNEVDYWKDKYVRANTINDKLVDKIGELWTGESAA